MAINTSQLYLKSSEDGTGLVSHFNSGVFEVPLTRRWTGENLRCHRSLNTCQLFTLTEHAVWTHQKT
jgi:hypothetical protein